MVVRDEEEHGTMGAGEHGTMGAGEHGTMGAGEHGTMGAGEHGTMGAGMHGTMGAGEHGTMGAGEHGTMGAGEHGTMGAGLHGTMGAGEHGTMGAGEHGTMGAGLHGTMGAGEHGTMGAGEHGTMGAGEHGTMGAARGRGVEAEGKAEWKRGGRRSGSVGEGGVEAWGKAEWKRGGRRSGSVGDALGSIRVSDQRGIGAREKHNGGAARRGREEEHFGRGCLPYHRNYRVSRVGEYPTLDTIPPNIEPDRVENPRLRHVDLARWCFSQYGLRPDRSTVGRILKSAERWAVTATGDNHVRRRGGAWPELEQAMARWIANAGPAGVPLTLQTIRDHVATMARNMGIPPGFRCSIGWVRRALRCQGVRCRASAGEAASADMAVVRDARDKLPHLLTHLSLSPRDTYNLDETALWLSVLPRRTYSNARIPGRKISKDRLTVAFLVNADGSHAFRPLVISKARRPHDFRPDYDPEAVCYWRHNAKGWMTAPTFTALWNDDGATSAVARYRPNLRDVLGWLSDAWMSVGARTIQRCWWRTRCLPLSWSLELTHVHDDEPTPHPYPDIELDEDINDVGTLISSLGLGNGAMTAAKYVAIDDGEPTSAETAAELLTDEPEAALVATLWRAPTTMQAVYDDADPVGREARRTARAACEMLIGYARAVSVTPRDLCYLFDIRNPVILERMERASPPINLNMAPPRVLTPGSTPTPDTLRPRGRVLPGWMTQPSRRQQLLDGGVGAAMGG
ncbi:unnamed protein product [Closterium sp. NIES-65]|nr:unnamed protein product [Closterium sp. NIES-65]